MISVKVGLSWAKATTNIEIYTAIAGGSWKKEDELRSLKGQAAELDRKIALTLLPPEPEKEEKQETVQGQASNTQNHNTQQKTPPSQEV